MRTRRRRYSSDAVWFVVGPFTDEEMEGVWLPIDDGDGGYQDFLRRLQRGARRLPDNGWWEIRALMGDVQRIGDYAFGHGDGGWQRRIKPLGPKFKAVLDGIKPAQNALFDEPVEEITDEEFNPWN